MTVGVYVHIPFCQSHCYYCAFYSAVERADVYDTYLDALLREMQARAEDIAGATVDSIYLGGGTPSLFGSERIGVLLAACRRFFTVSADCEVTMEANPASLSVDDYRQYSRVGVNRLSLGVQSFSDCHLQRVGRLHTAHEARQAVRRAYRAGLTDISIDLMYGLPEQSAASFRHSLLTAVHLPVSHISVYGLTVEEGTYFGRLQEQGRLRLPNEAEEWKMYQDMCRILPHYGFERYEIANFTRHGKRSRHNQKYWRYMPYLGLGAAATSFLGNRRRTNVADWKQYVAGSTSSFSPCETETLTGEQLAEEYVFMHLRTREGVDTAAFARRFGIPFRDCYPPAVVAGLQAEGLLIQSDSTLRLTPRGMALANRVMAKFILT